jgi:tagatose-1,6-bisphosphate aldolase
MAKSAANKTSANESAAGLSAGKLSPGKLSPGKLWGMRRMADENGLFKMTAVDQRPPIKNPIKEKRGTPEAPYEDVMGFKLMLVEELQKESSAMLLDPHFALPKGLSVLSPTKGLIVTLEDSIFAENKGGRLSAEIDHWSVEKIKRAGGDAVKVLAWYRPDASPSVRMKQKDFAERIGAACARYDIPYLFELLVYPLAGEANQTKDYIEMSAKHSDHVLESVRAFSPANFGIDVFKLESPLPAKDVPGLKGEGADKALGGRRDGRIQECDGACLCGRCQRLSRRTGDLAEAVPAIPGLGCHPSRFAQGKRALHARPECTDRCPCNALAQAPAVWRPRDGAA